MLEVKTMTREDMTFAVNLTNLMGWKLGVGDFEFMMELEPEGCFVLFHNSERVGIVTTIVLDGVSWFGNLIVSEPYRGTGAGSMLTAHAIKYLKQRNVKTVGLYAYMDKIPFYERFGFKRNWDFVVLKGKSFLSPTSSGIKQSRTTDIGGIIDFDRQCMGFSRRKLLEPILLDSDNLCFISVDDSSLSGYVIAKPYQSMVEVGPLVCRRGRVETALDLLKTTLGKMPGFKATLCIAMKHTEMLDTLKSEGFTEEFRVTRMYHGLPIEADCVYAAESLERG